MTKTVQCFNFFLHDSIIWFIEKHRKVNWPDCRHQKKRISVLQVPKNMVRGFYVCRLDKTDNRSTYLQILQGNPSSKKVS